MTHFEHNKKRGRLSCFRQLLSESMSESVSQCPRASYACVKRMGWVGVERYYSSPTNQPTNVLEYYLTSSSYVIYIYNTTYALRRPKILAFSSLVWKRPCPNLEEVSINLTVTSSKADLLVCGKRLFLNVMTLFLVPGHPPLIIT